MTSTPGPTASTTTSAAAPAAASGAAVSMLGGVVVSSEVAAQAASRLLRRDFDRWAEQAASCGHCARPVRMVGSTITVNTTSGEVVNSYRSADEPDGVTYIRCGNRRASVCPSCSREYQGDMWHLVLAGAAGGDKGVPETVAEHPMVFATLTAPSFGLVHTAKKPGHKGSLRCRPRARSAARTLCPHGRPTWCMRTHTDTDRNADRDVGAPLCVDCYDYPAHVIWQWWSGELWRRFTITLRRRLARHLGLSETAARKLVRVQYVKVAEYQLRGAVHFHTLIRLDGPPLADDPFPAPLATIETATLAQLVRDAASAVYYDADPIDEDDTTRTLRFGPQIDARPIIDDDASGLSRDRVAGYIAKYVIKATDDLGDPVLHPGAGLRRSHLAQLSQTVTTLDDRIADTPAGRHGPYALLGRYRSSYGYRGHCASKTRSYSTTMGKLRQARRDHHRRPQPQPVVVGEYDLADHHDAETLTVLGNWQFTGLGWLTKGDAALAADAAARCREYEQERAAERRR